MDQTAQGPRQRAADAWRRARDVPWLTDAALVGVLLFFLLFLGAGLGSPASLVLSVLQIVPLLWRRRRPLPVALVVAGGCALQVVFMDTPMPANVAVLIAVYSAAASGTRTTSRVVLGLGLAGALIAAIDWTGPIYTGTDLGVLAVQAVFMACFVGVAWTLGDVMRRRREVVSRLQEQNRALARDQAQRARLAAQDERATIAREMHDVVAHSLAVVVVQADGGLYAARQALSRGTGEAADQDRQRAALEQAATTLETLAETARASLADTRRLVGVLRDPGSDPEYAPLQGLAHLDDLVQRVRASGVDVSMHVRGEVDGLSTEADLAAYRVVQEALTNAMKHAGPGASVDVDLLRTPEVLLVRVTDDGDGAAQDDHDGEGNGLIGMRERVEVLGGSVSAGPRARRGWEVVATLPVARATDEPGAPRDRSDDAEPAARHTSGGTR
ncbi:hypothetical protein BJF80_04670 [Serinicoccus sp. CUA-874]|uniref:sensor histidine kinase n=1 Tax=Serinicoccus sp. CUA-874 TaxID=1517939 RepID=UPI00095907E6|nr:ATP-binding protein [Serinicoccus sp. CUA-874]OLT16647.1 hypothetical protein BJF80_04670 [Serinicoccus sp. CUA-874]